MAGARAAARAQLVRALLPGPAPTPRGAPARVLRLVCAYMLDAVERAAAAEKAAFNVAVTRCRKRQVVAHGKHVPATWEDHWFRDLYAKTVRQGVNALRDADVRRRYRDDSVSPRDLVALPAWELRPDMWRREIAVDAVKLESIPDGSVRCRKCGSKKTTWTTKQLRSADEPATAFFTCFGCGRHWKGAG